jgi:hypothetical protein
MPANPSDASSTTITPDPSDQRHPEDIELDRKVKSGCQAGVIRGEAEVPVAGPMRTAATAIESRNCFCAACPVLVVVFTAPRANRTRKKFLQKKCCAARRNSGGAKTVSKCFSLLTGATAKLLERASASNPETG